MAWKQNDLERGLECLRGGSFHLNYSAFIQKHKIMEQSLEYPGGKIVNTFSLNLE